jgi:hypothetical protein
MPEKIKHTKIPEKDFIRYSTDQMDERERNLFEKKLQQEPFDEDAMGGISNLSPDQIKADITELNKRLHSASNATNRYAVYRIAAGIAVLFSISTLFYFLLDRKITVENGPVILTEVPELKEFEKDAQKTYIEPVVQDPEIAKGLSSKQVIPQTNPGNKAEELSHEKTNSQMVNSSEGASISQISSEYDQNLNSVNNSGPVTTPNIEYKDAEKQEEPANAPVNLSRKVNSSAIGLSELADAESNSKQKAEKVQHSGSVTFVPAIPLNGQKFFDKYIVDNQVFPVTKLTISEAKVVLEFLVDGNGMPFNINIIESPAKEFSDEATQLLLKGPNWLSASPPESATRITVIISKKE